jgi:hypothetical protein
MANLLNVEKIDSSESNEVILICEDAGKIHIDCSNLYDKDVIRKVKNSDINIGV